MSNQKIYGSISFESSTLVLRDIEERDIEPIVSYWHDNSSQYLASIGVDLSKIKSRDETAEKFRASMQRAARQPGGRATLIVSEQEAIGYTNVNFHSGGIAYGHVHIINPKYRRMGVLSAFFPLAIRTFVEEFEIRQLRFQVNTQNVPINSFLQKQGMRVMDTVYLEEPDGMSLAGTYNLYVVEYGQRCI